MYLSQHKRDDKKKEKIRFVGKCCHCLMKTLYKYNSNYHQCATCCASDFVCYNDCNEILYPAVKIIEGKKYCGRCYTKYKDEKREITEKYNCCICGREFEFGNGLMMMAENKEIGLCSGCIIPKMLEVYAKSDFIEQSQKYTKK